jgi:hypothetical protein
MTVQLLTSSQIVGLRLSEARLRIAQLQRLLAERVGDDECAKLANDIVGEVMDAIVRREARAATIESGAG